MSLIENPSIKAARKGRAARITLNEPSSLNALSPAMVTTLYDQLKSWRDDASVEWVVIDGAGSRAFSAGANVRDMWRHAVAGEYSAIRSFFEQEYSIQLLLSEYPKPCIVVVDGICFGAGMGLAVNALHSVASETASFCMPETLIGFIPDAGATWFLSNLPSGLGMYLGLTGARLTGADAVRLGLVGHFVPHERFEEIVHEIVDGGPHRLATIDFPLPDFSLSQDIDRIQRCFSSESLARIFGRLDEDPSDWAEATRESLSRRSPAALRLTFKSLRHPGRNLRECLRNELDLVTVSTRHPDFREGVRAALIQGDKAPRWQKY